MLQDIPLTVATLVLIITVFHQNVPYIYLYLFITIILPFLLLAFVKPVLHIPKTALSPTSKTNVITKNIK